MSVSLRGFRNQFANLSCSVKSVFQAFYNILNVFDCKIQYMPVAVCEQAFFLLISLICAEIPEHSPGIVLAPS